MKKKSKQRPPELNLKSVPGDQVDWNLRWKFLIVMTAVLSFGLSVFNGYVLDDFIVIVKNNFTQKGFEGIRDILSKDTFAGMTESNIMVLSGGRYRPLSVVTFAIENQLWGNAPKIAHLINVTIYALCGILLFDLMKQLLSAHAKDRKQVTIKAALISILFIALPAHSEPVINIKGRDDLMCLLFFLLASSQLMNYARSGKRSRLLLSLLFYFLSLMSKETALTFIFIFPLLLYFFSRAEISKKISAFAGYCATVLLFLFLRYLATNDNAGIPSTDVLNDPFVNMTSIERLATIFYSWIHYFKLMIFPLKMSYDYNYNQFPLMTFSDPAVIFSVLFHLFLVYVAIKGFRKKSVYSFAILFYLVTFSILSNFFFNIGTIFADRFMLIPSLGFCIILIEAGFGIYQKSDSASGRKIIKGSLVTLLAFVLLSFNVRNISRCSDWKDNNTLFIADTDDAPKSAKVQLNAGIAYLTLESTADSTEKVMLINKAIEHLQKGIDIYPAYIDGYMNMGVAYSRLGNIQLAEEWWNRARKINPLHPGFNEYNKIISVHYYNMGLSEGVAKNFIESIAQMRMALKYDSTNAEIFYNLGGAYFTIQRMDSAKYFFSKTLEINPSYEKAILPLRVIQMQGN